MFCQLKYVYCKFLEPTMVSSYWFFLVWPWVKNPNFIYLPLYDTEDRTAAADWPTNYHLSKLQVCNYQIKYLSLYIFTQGISMIVCVCVCVCMCVCVCGGGVRVFLRAAGSRPQPPPPFLRQRGTSRFLVWSLRQHIHQPDTPPSAPLGPAKCHLQANFARRSFTLDSQLVLSGF